MSGTSADGIDAVLARIQRRGAHLRARTVAHVHEPFPPALRRRILDVCTEGHVAEICELNFVLGERFARAALAVMDKAGVAARRVYAIGSHGQTIHHLPAGRPASTMQIAEAAIIAERTGITTVADFRVRDMAAGGQGAPLVPYADWALFTHPTRPRILQNIGGIANLTYLPPNAGIGEVIAFDTGPGNVVIDALIGAFSGGQKRFDRGGAWAAKGKVSERLLSDMMKHKFLQREPPKTTGREEFGEAFVRPLMKAARKLRLSPADILATATAFTARTIAQAYRQWVFRRLPKQASACQVILAGGGAKNETLCRRLAAELPGVELMNIGKLGVTDSAKEALAFAILAFETLAGRPGNIPTATGAAHPVILGKIIPGRSLNTLCHH
jgi:anhydro-N-acetylmuramic acid kinase